MFLKNNETAPSMLVVTQDFPRATVLNFGKFVVIIIYVSPIDGAVISNRSQSSGFGVREINPWVIRLHSDLTIDGRNATADVVVNFHIEYNDTAKMIVTSAWKSRESALTEYYQFNTQTRRFSLLKNNMVAVLTCIV